MGFFPKFELDEEDKAKQKMIEQGLVPPSSFVPEAEAEDYKWQPNVTLEDLEKMSKRVDMNAPVHIDLPMSDQAESELKGNRSPAGWFASEDEEPSEQRVPATQGSPKVPSVREYIAKKYNIALPDDLSDGALKQAQDDAKTNNLVAGLGEAASMIGSAIAGQKHDSEPWKRLQAGANSNVEDLLKRRKAFSDEQQVKMTQMKLGKESALHDPNSSESQSFRKIIEANFPKIASAYGNTWNDVSAADKDLLFDPLKLKEQIEARKDAARLAADARKDTLREKQQKEAKLSDKQAESIGSIDKAISALDNVIAQKEAQKWDTGPLSFGMNKVAGWVGMDDAAKSAFKSDVGEQLAQYIKSISGATVSPTERAALLQNVPSVMDNDATFMAKANALKSRLNKTRDIELGTYRKQGKDVSNWLNASTSKSDEYSEAQERGIKRVMDANGISREEAVDALKRAGKL